MYLIGLEGKNGRAQSTVLQIIYATNCCSRTVEISDLRQLRLKDTRYRWKGSSSKGLLRSGSNGGPPIGPCNQSFNSCCTRKRIIHRCCVLCERVRRPLSIRDSCTRSVVCAYVRMYAPYVPAARRVADRRGREKRI